MRTTPGNAAKFVAEVDAPTKSSVNLRVGDAVRPVFERIKAPDAFDAILPKMQEPEIRKGVCLWPELTELVR